MGSNRGLPGRAWERAGSSQSPDSVSARLSLEVMLSDPGHRGGEREGKGGKEGARRTGEEETPLGPFLTSFCSGRQDGVRGRKEGVPLVGEFIQGRFPEGLAADASS